MPSQIQYIPVKAVSQSRGPMVSAITLAIRISALALIAFGALMAWRWLDANLLNWGIDDGRTATISRAELLERIQAFELVTIKHTNDSSVSVDAAKELNAGPARVSLPGWVAGQRLDVSGRITVTAGVDLARVRPEDMQIVREGTQTKVIVSLPAPEIFAAELVPNTLDIDTSQGVLTRLRTRLGLSEKDLRDGSVDRLVEVAKLRAVERGILDEARIEAERRLQAFLNSLPNPDGGVTYVVIVSAPAEI